MRSSRRSLADRGSHARRFGAQSVRRLAPPRQLTLIETCSTFTTTLDIPEDAKAALMAMSPANYVGNAAAQAHAVTGHIKALRK